MVDGPVETKDGVQVIAVGVKDGYYSPNQFKAKAGIPVTVVFTGSTKGCIGKPTFKTLGKKADFNDTGSATIELGALAPGTYEFACGMDMVGGKIIVE
jgi:plastocyanin domain-containing protein